MENQIRHPTDKCGFDRNNMTLNLDTYYSNTYKQDFLMNTLSKMLLNHAQQTQLKQLDIKLHQIDRDNIKQRLKKMEDLITNMESQINDIKKDNHAMKINIEIIKNAVLRY
jgi:hypothetical protein